MKLLNDYSFILLLVLFGVFLGVFLYPYFPDNIPFSSASLMLQSLIEVNGVLLGFAGVIFGIIGFNTRNKLRMRRTYASMGGAVATFFISIIYDLIDLANMTSAINKGSIIRDIVLTIIYAIGIFYITSTIQKTSK